MKTTTKSLNPWMLSVLCLALATGAGAQNQTPPNGGNPDATTSAGMPGKYNRASGIIGMEVRNQNDEDLGRIKDVVFDLKTERVSYAVLSVSPKNVFGQDKYLAVPLNALTASPDDKHLILNADKSKVEAAAGFDRNNWPSVGNPSWGAEPFWQSNDMNGADHSTPPADKPSQAPNSMPAQPNQ